MAREMMYGEAIGTAMTEEMQRDASVVFYGQNHGHDRARSHAEKVRQEARSHRAHFGDRRDGHCRRARRSQGFVPSLNYG